MAITKSISLRGITIPGAYIRIDRIMGGKYSGFQAEAGIYAGPGVPQPLEIIGFNFGFVDGTDLMVTAYEAAKSLPEFSGCSDC
ncbi:MAG: hypothetical protein V5B31_02060 [Candidatus Accumulibacter propinquus]|jgi:hypothetical protein|uniref:hypothetical protein n=1 Tax=Candidatus Accumulibacter propinquus TaxID=2954380 RepID=UPI002FC31AD0